MVVHVLAANSGFTGIVRAGIAVVTVSGQSCKTLTCLTEIAGSTGIQIIAKHTVRRSRPASLRNCRKALLASLVRIAGATGLTLPVQNAVERSNVVVTLTEETEVKGAKKPVIAVAATFAAIVRSAVFAFTFRLAGCAFHASPVLTSVPLGAVAA